MAGRRRTDQRARSGVISSSANAFDPVRVEVSGLTKTFGTMRAVDDLSSTVEPDTVTGFLGSDGAGKTTTLRMALGLLAAALGVDPAVRRDVA